MKIEYDHYTALLSTEIINTQHRLICQSFVVGFSIVHTCIVISIYLF